MKKYFVIIMVLIIANGLVSCGKETSVDSYTPPSVVTVPFAKGSLHDSTGNCQNITIHGSFVKGVALNATNYITAQVNFTTAGKYNVFTYTANGCWFSTDTAVTTSTGTQTVTLNATANYSCTTGYTLIGTSCSRAQTLSASPTYACTDGSVLSGNECVTLSNVTTSATIDSYECPTGYALLGSTCTTTVTLNASISSYSCPSGYEFILGSCISNISSSAQPVYTCSDGYSLIGSTCTQTLSQVATPNYICSTGTLTQSSCITTVAASIKSYSCPFGFTLSASTCTQTLTQLATLDSYNCPGGGTLTGSGAGSVCVTITTVPAALSYSCADGAAPHNGVCMLKSATVSWNDTCGVYEASSGQALGVP